MNIIQRAFNPSCQSPRISVKHCSAIQTEFLEERIRLLQRLFIVHWTVELICRSSALIKAEFVFSTIEHSSLWISFLLKTTSQFRFVIFSWAGYPKFFEQARPRQRYITHPPILTAWQMLFKPCTVLTEHFYCNEPI